VLLFVAAAAAAVSFFVCGHSAAMSLGVAMCSLGSLRALWGLGARGSATFEQMLDDVATALQWVQANRASLPQHGPKVVFGGYSSGGHVASSLLQRPDVLAAHGLPSRIPELCDGVLLLSGVLGTRPTAGSKAPRWLTDAVNALVWGDELAALPSPVHAVGEIGESGGTASPAELPPHLLVGCRHEVFGLRMLDTYFCAADYAAVLGRRGVKARHVEVASDHWNVLNSAALSRALREELCTRDWPACESSDAK